MAVVFLFFHLTKKRLGSIAGYICLPAYWIAFEYLHLNWDFSWPWLTIGNGFGNWPATVQWYEYTGVLGGSLWVITVNIIGYLAIQQFTYRKGIALFLLITVPILFSLARYHFYSESPDPVNVVVVQPNVDPYGEKFTEPAADQISRLLRLAAEKTDSAVDYVIGPETALSEGVCEDHLQTDAGIEYVRKFISSFPKLKAVFGISSYKSYDNGQAPSSTARKFSDADRYYDAYNTALQLDNKGEIQVYHKSRLVPGVEKMPYPNVFGFLDRFTVDLGGTSGSLGMQEDRTVFVSKDSVKVAPVICYESIYGEFLAGYIRNGAELIFIITNDGWWGDTPGYRQHLSYARLRAIEFRRSIARSANTGISCLIDQRGVVIQPTEWWKPAVIRETLNRNDEMTFYAEHGDYIARVAVFVSFCLLLLLVIPFRKK